MSQITNPSPSGGGRRSFASYHDFWPYYVSQHRKAATRQFHFAGTSASLLLIAATIIWALPWLLIVLPFAAYGPAWFSHFVIEGNKPATFEYPVYSLIGDFRMYGLMWSGRMTDEVQRVAGVP